MIQFLKNVADGSGGYACFNLLLLVFVVTFAGYRLGKRAEDKENSNDMHS